LLKSRTEDHNAKGAAQVMDIPYSNKRNFSQSYLHENIMLSNHHQEKNMRMLFVSAIFVLVTTFFAFADNGIIKKKVPIQLK